MENKEDKDIAKRAKQILEDQGISQKDFATLVNKSESTVSGYLRGAILIPVWILIKICETGQVSLDWLITGKDQSQQDSRDESTERPFLPEGAEEFLGLPRMENYRFNSELYENNDLYKSVVDAQKQLMFFFLSYQPDQIQSDDLKDLQPQFDTLRANLDSLGKKLKKALSKPFKYKKEVAQYPEYSEDRAHFIWNRGCKDAGMPGFFDKSTLALIEHYKQKRLTDSELYDNAFRWAKAQLSLIKKVDQRNSHT